VAAHAQHHIKVCKQQDAQGRAATVFDELSDQAARLDEVAAMLGLGADVAADMLAAAQGWPAARVQQLLAGWPGPKELGAQGGQRQEGRAADGAAGEQVLAGSGSGAAGNGSGSRSVGGSGGQ
jgi:hypothetical protein